MIVGRIFEHTAPPLPWDRTPVRAELFGAERLEQHAKSLAAAQAVTGPLRLSGTVYCHKAGFGACGVFRQRWMVAGWTLKVRATSLMDLPSSTRPERTKRAESTVKRTKVEHQAALRRGSGIALSGRNPSVFSDALRVALQI